tara:strand:+ start:3370 stop:4857 length:1488 start_codon:yes stop_codon:yes gene_type:complete
MSKNKEKTPSQKDINNLLQLYNAGDNINAEKLAVLLTQNFPNHPFAWKVLGAVLKNIGELSRSLEVTHRALELNPLDAEVYNNLGNTAMKLDLIDEAEKYYKKAIEINPVSFSFHHNLGRLFVHSQKFNEAQVSYKEALILNPGLSGAHFDLGEVQKTVGKITEAEESFKKAIALEPENPIYYTCLGLVQRDFGRYHDAETSYRKTLALDPKNDNAHYNLGIVLFEHRHYKEAAEHFNLTNISHSKSFELKCYYLLGEQSIFYEKLENMVQRGKADAVIGSLSCRSEVRYGIKKPNPFCNDPIKYVLKTDLTQGYDFKNIFINEVKDILTEDQHSKKSQGLITNGYQTSGNLFHRKSDAVKEIINVIHLEIERYRSHYNDSDEGVITKWPENYDLYGWLISMKNGGELASHMHDNGWLSGSIYINVPPKSEKDSGNLVVRIDDEKNEIIGKNQTKSIDVVTGSLCLFPSSLLHHTIPFMSDEERIVLAFDVIRAS